jgi:hypothetical protein
MEYASLARSYNTLSYAHQLRELLAAFFQTEVYNAYSKFEAAKVVNDLLSIHYHGEQILKYRLADYFIQQHCVGAFEVKAKSSRADFLVINGDTRSFEIKSKVDTLNRLEKQVSDYGDVFEYNTVVLDKSHLTKVIGQIPEYYGVWYYEGIQRVVYRNPERSPLLSSVGQLQLFNKAELTKSFGFSSHQQVIAHYNNQQINAALKENLKERYSKRWAFIKRHWDKILPIDLQFFFSTNVRPEVVYDL